MSEREPFPPEDDDAPEPAVPPTSVPEDVPEADAIEQAVPIAGGTEDDEPPSVPADVPEADAIEQHTTVGEPPDDEYRG